MNVQRRPSSLSHVFNVFDEITPAAALGCTVRRLKVEHYPLLCLRLDFLTSLIGLRRSKAH